MSSMIISTGGTGGHVIPAKVFYDYFKKKFNVKIISDKRGLNFIEKENYNIHDIQREKDLYEKNFNYVESLEIKIGDQVICNRNISRIVCSNNKH